MKNILNKIYFHPIFLLTTLIFILIGKFRFISYFMLIIIIHELGHIVSSLYFKWNIEKIIILPFGGLTKFRESINRPLIEEFIVAISGIIFQLIFYIFARKIITYRYFAIINYFILVFNLIPIYPLDGSKIVSFILNKIFSFKKSIYIIIYISYISILITFLLSMFFNKLIIITLIFLLLETYKLDKNSLFIFNKFLLERYLNNFKFKKLIMINNIDEMKKDYRHLFSFNNIYRTEKVILKEMFDNKGKV